MAKTLAYGPNSTPVEGLATLTNAIAPVNFAADFRVIEDVPGKLVMADITSSLDQPSTLRIAQQSKANIYAGTTIDPSAFLANRRGTETIVDMRETWAITDSGDPAFLQLAPARAAIMLSLPTSSLITADAVMRLVNRAVASLFAQGDATPADGVNALLHGVVSRD